MVPKEISDEESIKKYLDSYDYDQIITGEISPLKNARKEFEKRYIIQALKINNKNITSTSKSLGVERTNLHRKIKMYNIDLEKI